jgi:uncharacterized membrane protein YgdD (TMEM256/DUF423 family)
MKLGVSGIVGALAVATGAFGAHALKNILTPDALAVWNTGAHYHLIHAVLLVVVAFQAGTDRGLERAWYMLLAGIVSFSGSLYVLAWSGIHIVGAITPFGGLLLIAGWLQLGWSGWRARKSRR